MANSIVPPMRTRSPSGVRPAWMSAKRIPCRGITFGVKRNGTPSPAPSGSGRRASVSRVVHEPAARTNWSAAMSPAPVRTDRTRPLGRSNSIASAPSSTSTPIAPHLRAEAVDERVRLHVPLLVEVEARLDPVVQRRLEPVDLVLAEDVVRERVAVARMPSRLRRILRASSGFAVAQTMPSFHRSNSTPSAASRSVSSKDDLPRAASAAVPRS